MSDSKTPPDNFGIKLTFGDDTKSFAGWVELSKEKIVSTDAPWRQGSLIQIRKSPAPGKIPNNSVAMFLSYKFIKYNISSPREKDNHDSVEEDFHSHENSKNEYFQHKVTVLFNEKVMDLYSQELSENFDEIIE